VEGLNQLHLLRPLWLLALPLWLLLCYALMRGKRSENSWSSLVDPALLGYLVGEEGAGNRSSRWLLPVMIGGALLVIALAGPAWQKLPQQVYRAHTGMVLILDLSQSMLAADLKPSRLARAKQKLQDILKARHEGETGLIVFAGSAFDVVPMTTDNKAIVALLGSLEPSMMPIQGSNASIAIDHARAMLKRGTISHGSVVLIGDGIDKAAMQQAEMLRAAGHTLSLIGVGTLDGAPIPEPDGGFFQDGQGNIVLPRLDEPALAALASHAGGIYQRIRLDDRDLLQLPGLQPQLMAEQTATQLNSDQWREQGPWLVALLLPFFALLFRRGTLFLLLLTPLLLPKPADAMSWNDWWQTPDQQGQAVMQQGDAGKAVSLFHDPAWKGAAQYQAGDYQAAAKTLAGVDNAGYNRGNALARAGQLKEALAAYDQALKQQPDDADALFNRDLVKKLLAKQQQQDQKKKQKKDQKGKQGKEEQKDGQKSKQQGGKQDKSGQQGDQQASSGEQQQGESSGKNGKPGKQNDTDRAVGADKPMPGEQRSGDPKKPDNQEKQQQAAERQSSDGSKAEQQGVVPDPSPPKQAKAARALPVDKKQQEAEVARQQWLRRIPDDPGGLLRRKFKYQYQQQGEQSTGGQPW